MKWSHLGGFCGFLNSGPLGGPPFGPPLGPPHSRPGRNLLKSDTYPEPEQLLGSRKSLQVRKSRDSLRIKPSPRHSHGFSLCVQSIGTVPNKDGAPPRGPRIQETAETAKVTQIDETNGT